jgi:hypothetical protein
MSDTLTEDDEGLPPGDEETTVYRATDFERGGGRAGAGFLWFACKDATRDRVLQLANLREMEPSYEAGKAVLHFSGMEVVLTGSGLRRIVHCIYLGRCSRILEIRADQQPAQPDDPVVERIEFLVPPPPESGGPKDEPEVRHRKNEKA